MVWLWDHDPFGNGQPTGSSTYNLRFPGQFYDQQSTLHYNYFRDYDPRTGRYIESDPIGLAGGINAYTYAAGTPTTSVDSYGLLTLWKPWAWILDHLPIQRLTDSAVNNIKKKYYDEQVISTLKYQFVGSFECLGLNVYASEFFSQELTRGLYYLPNLLNDPFDYFADILESNQREFEIIQRQIKEDRSKYTSP